MQRKPNLGQVLEIVKSVFGYDSWVANNFLSDVKADNSIPTLCIDKRGIIYYNEEFWNKKINTPNKVIESICHELLHKVFGDFTRSPDELENFAADCVINYAVTVLTGHGDLFDSLYAKKMPSGLLRQGAYKQAKKSKYDKIYNKIWDKSYLYMQKYSRRYGYSNTNNHQACHPDDFTSIEDVYHALRVLSTKVPQNTVLIGSHGGNSNDNKESKPGDQGEDIDTILDREMHGKLADDLLKQLQKKSEAGYNTELLKGIIKVISSECTLKQELLKDFAISNNINRIKTYCDVKRKLRSVIPIRPSRREMALLASGVYPVFWSNEYTDKRNSNKGIVFYIDVSGSMDRVLPKILGLVVNFRDTLDKVFVFSNEIHETTLRELAHGKIKSTGGTDFNCIIRHAVENHFEKIIVITDGYAHTNDECKNLALSHIEKACIIYSSKQNIGKNNFFEKHYGTSYILDDVVKMK